MAALTLIKDVAAHRVFICGPLLLPLNFKKFFSVDKKRFPATLRHYGIYTLKNRNIPITALNINANAHGIIIYCDDVQLEALDKYYLTKDKVNYRKEITAYMNNDTLLPQKVHAYIHEHGDNVDFNKPWTFAKV